MAETICPLSAPTFAPLPADGSVLRLARVGSSFLPAGHTLPEPGWLTPSSADKAEAAARQRIAGLSAWDVAGCNLAQARDLANRPDDQGFVAPIASLYRTASEGPVVARLQVVRDELIDAFPRSGWDAHVLIEGLERPQGVDRKAWKDLQTTLVRCFQPYEP
jgi:hypothetical protein